MKLTQWLGQKRGYGGVGQPPLKIRTTTRLEFILLAGLSIALVLVAQAVLRHNRTPFSALHVLDHIVLLSIDQAITILLTVVGLYSLERQFARSFSPSLQTSMVGDSEITLASLTREPYEHRCYLRNMGPGRATIIGARYRLEFFEPTERVAKMATLDHFQTISALQDRDLVVDVDFFMPRLAANVTHISPDSSRLIHLSNGKFDSLVRILDVELTYEDTLGERYQSTHAIIYRYRSPRQVSVRSIVSEENAASTEDL